MRADIYTISTDPTNRVFQFESIGVRGKIKKQIEFQDLGRDGYFNLAFGDVDDVTGEIDDLAVSANGDTEMVLGTVVAALELFFASRPEATVFAEGSTIARTRLYQMGINKYYDPLISPFDVFGICLDHVERFRREGRYDGFFVTLKTT